MTETELKQKIDFTAFTPNDKALYEKFLFEETDRGCEFSFANLYLWGRQKFALVNNHIVLISRFDKRITYPYPLGKGDKKAVLDSIIADAKARGITCRMTGLSESAKHTLEALYPGRFRFCADEGTFDYVYAIDDLADLKGKKYHGKRNHLNRFYEAYPDYTVKPIGDDNAAEVRRMLENWYRIRTADNADADYSHEQDALDKALRDYRRLKMEGLVLYGGGELLAFTLASRLTHDTLDVHFEKARADVQGAYTAINCEFAKYIRSKYPQIKWLDREEDMGLEGLRKAKQSYRPHHMIKKYRACMSLKGDCHED